MAIVKDLTITVNGSSSKLSKDVYLWLGDGGVTLLITILESDYIFGTFKTGTNLVEESSTKYAQGCILKANNETIYSEKCEILDGKIKFEIEKEFIDEIEEEGSHLLQFHLFDEEENRLSVPPVTFNILKPICDIGHRPTP